MIVAAFFQPTLADGFHSCHYADISWLSYLAFHIAIAAFID